MKILTPHNEEFEVSILSRRIYNEIHLSNKVIEVSYIKNLVRDIPILRLDNNSFLIEYTESDFGILIKNKEILDKINRTDQHDLINIIKNENRYYYSFNLNSGIISCLLEDKHELLSNYGKIIYSPPGFENLKSIVIMFENGSILNYIKRDKNVFQGDWFSNIENFKFYYDNDYTM